jgi:hypothetical protein
MALILPWRKTADRIILARLRDVLSIDAMSPMPMMYRILSRSESTMDDYVTRDDVLRAMGWDDLTKIQQTVLTAACRDGQRIDEIAEAAGVHYVTIYRTRARALDKIYLALADDEVLAEIGPVHRAQTYPGRRGPSGYISFALRISVYRRDRFTCQHCGVQRELSIDHIHPFSKGGSTIFENLQTLCRRCNSRKGARVLDTV